jgi:polar amino acid transport system substrate-binding protein
MIKKLFMLFFILAFATHLFANSQTISIRTDLWCPYACDPKSDKPGYMVEIAKEAFSAHGIKINYDVLNWARSLSDTKLGLYDAVVGASRSDVKGFILPKNPSGKNLNHYFVLKESDWKYKNSQSLDGKKIGVINDYTYGDEIDRFVSKHHPSFTKITGDDPLERIVKMTKAKRLDAFVENPLVLRLKLEELKLPLDLFKMSSKNLSDDTDLFIAFSPKNSKSKEYASLFDKELQKMKKDGRLKKILSKYNVEMWK